MTDDGGAELVVLVDDDRTEVVGPGGSNHVLPIGARSLTDSEFGRLDPPPPMCLTNALGLVHDHFDDVLIDAPEVALAASIRFVGHHTTSLACVEIGSEPAPPSHRVSRDELEALFRTLVAEPAGDRRANPGLDDGHLDTIIATCCVVLAIMRRLSLREATFAQSVPPRSMS